MSPLKHITIEDCRSIRDTSSLQAMLFKKNISVPQHGCLADLHLSIFNYTMLILRLHPRCSVSRWFDSESVNNLSFIVNRDGWHTTHMLVPDIQLLLQCQTGAKLPSTLFVPRGTLREVSLKRKWHSQHHQTIQQHDSLVSHLEVY